MFIVKWSDGNDTYSAACPNYKTAWEIYYALSKNASTQSVPQGQWLTIVGSSGMFYNPLKGSIPQSFDKGEDVRVWLQQPYSE